MVDYTDHFVRELCEEFPDLRFPSPSRRQADINEEIGLSLTRHLVYEHGSPSNYLRRLQSIKTLQSVHRKFHQGDTRPLR